MLKNYWLLHPPLGGEPIDIESNGNLGLGLPGMAKEVSPTVIRGHVSRVEAGRPDKRQWSAVTSDLFPGLFRFSTHFFRTRDIRHAS